MTSLEFFNTLNWIDGKPLQIDDYRKRIFTSVLDTLDDSGNPIHSWALCGRGKKNFKSCDLILAALYRFMIWESINNDCLIVANDLDQANDDLSLAKLVIAANPILADEVTVKSTEIVRNDGKGTLRILPARDVAGAHGKQYVFLGYDEIHGYKDYGLIEALAPDPTRRDALVWITSYDCLSSRPGIPLHDYKDNGINGTDPALYFSWYSGELCTDPEFADLPPEPRANPSMASWGNPGYLDSQRRRLPSHKFRRLHLNLPGAPDGAFFDADVIESAIVKNRKHLQPIDGVYYKAFTDMSGGSSDDACLGIAHYDENTNRTVVDIVINQTGGKVPFNPRDAVRQFAEVLKRYRVSAVTGDNYGGSTFKNDFEDAGISYNPCPAPKSSLYESLEVTLNTGEVELLDNNAIDQLLGLVLKGGKIDHQNGGHDDWANALAGVVWLCSKSAENDSIPDDIAGAFADTNDSMATGSYFKGSRDAYKTKYDRGPALNGDLGKRSPIGEFDYDCEKNPKKR